MRFVVPSIAAVLVALLAAPVLAQAPPPDTVTQVIRQKARPDMQSQYEAGRKKHMAWHKAQNDTWAWDVFEIISGPDTGGYLIATGNHQWKDIDLWTAKMGDADTADSAASIGGAAAGSQVAYWTQLNSISRLPAANERLPMATVTYFRTKPGSDAALRAAIGKLNAALDAGTYPLRSIWYVLSSGGAGPTYAVVTPRAGFSDMAVNPGLRDVLDKQLGKAPAEALLKAFLDNVTSTSSEMLQRRPDLSYVPQ